MIVKFSAHNLKFRIIALICFAIGLVSTGSTSFKTDNYSRYVVFSVPSAKPIESVSGRVVETADTTWKSTRIYVPSGARLSDFYFVDSNNGWAVNEKYVFRIIDGKRHRYPIDFVGKDEISFLRFTDEENGWLVLQHTAEEYEFSTDDQIRIYRTLDGGKTWRLKQIENAATYARAHVNNGHIWITFRWFLGYSPQHHVPVVLHFAEGLSKWVDLTDGLKKASFNSRYSSGFPTLSAISTDENGCLLASNVADSILKRCGIEGSWELVDDLWRYRRDDPSSGIKEVSSRQGYIWAMESVGGYYHGGATHVNLIPRGKNTKPRLLGLSHYYSSQAFSPSQNEFFLTSRKYDIEDPNPRFKGEILHTDDGGKIWRKIFRNRSEIKHAQFFSANHQKFVLLTQDGKLFRVTENE